MTFPRLCQQSSKRGLAPLLLLIFVSAALLTSCGSDSSPTSTPAIKDVAPVANFSATPNTADPLTVVFTDTSTPGSAAITAWSWDFGDGGSSTLQNPPHAYAASGNYDVRLTVTTTVGSNAKTLPYYVSVAPVAPLASFVSSRTSGSTPATVQFTDTSGPGSASITSWGWVFGDGAWSTEQNPSHTYTNAGFYDVSLTVVTPVGSNTMVSSDYFEAFDNVIIDTVTEGEFLPGIPVPDSYNSSLPARSDAKYLDHAWVLEFRPIISQLRLTYWTGTNGVNDCPDIAEGVPRPVDPVPFTEWHTGIPQRNTTDKFFWLLYTPNEAWPTAFPTRITLYTETYGSAGGVPRWSSCEEQTPAFSDYYTSYEISYNQPILQVPVIRWSRVWVKKVEEKLGSGSSYSRTETYTTGVENTEAYEFTASITASVTVMTPEMAATLSTTLSETFSSSITLSESSSIENTRSNPPHKDGYQLNYSIWQLVDRYTIEMPTVWGKLWSDPNYVLTNSQFVIEHPTETTAQQAVWFRQ
jgi:PKD repeat protein